VGDQPLAHQGAPADLELVLVVEVVRALDDGEFFGRVGDDRAGLGVPDLDAEGRLEVELVYVFGVLLAHTLLVLDADQQRYHPGAFAD